MFESEEDLYVTSTDYNQDYPLDDLPVSVATLPSSPAHSKYYSLDSLNSDVLGGNGKNGFFAIHLNAVSLLSHFDEIKSLISAKTKVYPDVLCISESRLKDSKIEAQLQLVSHPEYNLVFDNSPTSAGGAAIYVRKNHSYTVLDELKLKTSDCESIFIEITFPDKSILRNSK